MVDVTFVDEALKKIQSHKGVRGILIINGDGIPIRLLESDTFACCRRRTIEE